MHGLLQTTNTCNPYNNTKIKGLMVAQFITNHLLIESMPYFVVLLY